MKHKVLWVEDGAVTEVDIFTGPVLTSMKYKLEIALDVSAAIKKMRSNEYAAVIVDIRIPPDEYQDWETFYNQSGSSKSNARLGMQLLFSLLKPEMTQVKITDIPPWISADKFGVFTVESEMEIKNELEKLGVRFYTQKRTRIPDTALLDLIEKIMGSSTGNCHKGGN
ncbi:MAG: hypothetical protein L0Y76_12085 [Ignavibacteria bacterium]|nr:hypothetical protein [Ignavibacteria bacterium]